MCYEKYVKAGYEIDTSFKIGIRRTIGVYPLITDEKLIGVLIDKTILEYFYQRILGKTVSEAESDANCELQRSLNRTQMILCKNIDAST